MRPTLLLGDDISELSKILEGILSLEYIRPITALATLRRLHRSARRLAVAARVLGRGANLVGRRQRDSVRHVMVPQ